MYKNINVYEIQELCGKGAYGSVYLAKNSISQQRIALKVLSGKQQKRELEGLIRYRDIRHPNLMQIYHVDRTTDGELFYTMQLADNFNHQESPYIPDTLGHRLAQQERINPHELINIILELLDGLEVLHNAGFSHRDIKPDNILFIQKRAVLADIGLTDNLETTGDIGTPQFMPKKALKSYNQGDLYALGMVMYCALTGNNPNKFPKIPKDLPQECRSLIAICGKACNQEFNITQFKTALESTTAKKTNLKLIAGAVIGLMAMVIVGVSLHKPKETKVETKAEVVTPKTSETPQPVYQYEPPKTWDTPTIDIDEDNPIFTSLLVDKLYVNSDLPANKVRVYNKMYTLSSTPSISESSTIPTMGGGYTIKDSYEQVVIDYPCDKYTVSAGIYSGKPLGCSEKLPTIPKLEKYISYSFKCSNTLSMAEFKYFLDVLEQYYPPIPLEVARAAEKHYLEQWASYVENINIIEGNKERRKLVAKAVVWDDEARAKLAKTKEFKNYFRQEIELKDPLYALGELIVDIPEAIRLERSRLFTIENHMYRLNCAYKNYLEWKKTEKN